MKRLTHTALGACIALLIVAVARRLFPHVNYQIAAALAFVAIIIVVPLYRWRRLDRQRRRERKGYDL